MASMNVSLPEPMKNWVEQQAATGRYSNASDYVRALIRQDQERAEKILAMQQLVNEALSSGSPANFSVSDFLETMHKKHGSPKT